jgi:hypothetical protein
MSVPDLITVFSSHKLGEGILAAVSLSKFTSCTGLDCCIELILQGNPDRFGK